MPTFLSHLRCLRFTLSHPGLTPWAAFFRRFAAGVDAFSFFVNRVICDTAPRHHGLGVRASLAVAPSYAQVGR